jgi:hypothetical protein
MRGLEGIPEHLAGDPVDLVLKDRRQRLTFPFHGYAESRGVGLHVLRIRQVLPHRRQQPGYIALFGRLET